MKLLTTAALVSLGIAASTQAATIATTSFEAAEGFSTGVTGGFSVTDSNGDYWEAGATTGNYAGVWNGANNTGSLSAVIGNYGNPTPYVLSDAAGADGVGTFEFYIQKTGNVADANQDPLIQVQWTTDVLNGSETWNTALANERIDNTSMQLYNVAINQTGDVKVRIFLSDTFVSGGQSHISIDDITVTDFVAVPEPSSTALLGLGGLSLLLRRRR